MFDIGFQEILLISAMSLLIMGPERLPGAVRTGMLWLSKLRRSFQDIKSEIEREIGADEIRQQLHNEKILEQLEKTKQDVEKNLKATTDNISAEIDEIQHSVGDLDKPANGEHPAEPAEAVNKQTSGVAKS